MSIGTKLKEAREKKQLTLRQTYEKTRIHPDIINALEEDNYKRIPNPTYIKSFLKEYASFLGLNVNNILEEYNKLKAPKPKKTPAVVSEPQKVARPIKSVETIKSLSKVVTIIIKWAIILVLAAVVMLGVIKLLQSAAKNIKLKRAASKTQAIQKKETPKIETEKKKSVLKQTKPSEKPPQKIIIPKDKDLALTIVTSEDVWLVLKVDGKIIFDNILKRGSSESWKAKDNFAISTKKANAIQLNLNGNNLGAAGKGSVKNLVIDRTGKH